MLVSFILIVPIKDNKIAVLSGSYLPVQQK